MTLKPFGRHFKDISVSRARPKRPLSGYNIFFRFARAYIVSLYPRELDAVAFMFKFILNLDERVVKKMVFDIVEDYRSEEMNKNEKKGRSKTHGIIGFLELSNTVAKEWKLLDPSMKSIFNTASREDKKAYIIQRNAWMSEKNARIKQKLEEQYHKDQVSLNLSKFPNDKEVSFTASMVPSSPFPNTTNIQPFNVTSSVSPVQYQNGNICVDPSKSQFGLSVPCHQMLEHSVPARQVTPDIDYYNNTNISFNSTNYTLLDVSRQEFEASTSNKAIENQSTCCTAFPQGLLNREYDHDRDFHAKSPRKHQCLNPNDNLFCTSHLTSRHEMSESKLYSDFRSTEETFMNDLFEDEEELDYLLCLLE